MLASTDDALCSVLKDDTERRRVTHLSDLVHATTASCEYSDYASGHTTGLITRK